MRKVLGWFVGAFLVLVATGSIPTAPLAGILFLLAAAIVLPPVNVLLKKKFGVSIPGKVRLWGVLGLIVVAAMEIGPAAARKADRRAAGDAEARANAVRADFADSGPLVFARMDSALQARNYSLAASIGQRYAGVVDDSQFTRRYREATNGAKEQQLLAHAESLSATDLEANQFLYRQLVILNPANPNYQAKYDEYRNRIREREAAQQAQLANTLRSMRKSHDDVRGITWYYDPTTSQVVNSASRVLMYIGREDRTGSTWLRFSIRYVAENWLFIQRYLIKVDGVTFTIQPSTYGNDKIERDNGYLSNGDVGIWEWYDVTAGDQERAIAAGIAGAKRVVLRYEGQQYYRDRTVTQGEQASLRRVLDAYDALSRQATR